MLFYSHNDIIESAVRDSLEKRNIEVKNHLTPQDVFFREVSNILQLELL